MIAASGKTLDSKISGRFGHSGYFIIADPQTLNYKAYAGVGTDEEQNISTFIGPDIKKVIVGNIGPAMFNEITSFGCQVFLCRNMQVKEAIEKVKNGDVEELKVPTLKKSIHSARQTSEGKTGRRHQIEEGPDFGPEDSGGGGFGRGQGRDYGRRGRMDRGSGGGKGKGRGRR